MQEKSDSCPRPPASKREDLEKSHMARGLVATVALGIDPKGRWKIFGFGVGDRMPVAFSFPPAHPPNGNGTSEDTIDTSMSPTIPIARSALSCLTGAESAISLTR